MKWEHYLRVQTQNPQFLWRMVIGILVAGMACGFVAQFLSKSNSVEDLALALVQQTGVPRHLEELLDEANAPFEQILTALSYLALDEINTPQVTNLLARESLTENQRTIAQQLWASTKSGTPTTELKQLANASPQVRFANYALAAFHINHDAYADAARHFEIEGQLPNTEISREKAVETYGMIDDTKALARLSETPEYQPFISPYERVVIAAAHGDWQAVFWGIPRAILERFQYGAPTFLALFAGLGWFLVALQFGQARAEKGARWWLCALAVPLGCLSIWPTHFLDLWQKTVWGLEQSDELLNGVTFCVLSVGLREEFSKLLLLTPLMAWIVRRGNALEALIVSACVGLGFAMLENMSYFAATFGTSTIARFLTANFFHMAMTGLVGLALARAFWSPKQEAVQAIMVFLIVVIAHGFYDALLIVPTLAEFSQGMGAMIIFILLSYVFFHELRQLRARCQETISLTATFLFVVSLLTAVTFVYVCTLIGFRASGRMLFSDVASLGAMVYMYLREMPNSLLR